MPQNKYLILNTGNLFNYGSILAKLEARYIVGGLNLSGVNFIGVGAWDLAWGVDKVKELAPNSVADFVCANVDGFLPYIRFDRGGLKVLVTSIIDPELLKIYKVNDLKVENPSLAIQNLREKINHDFFIVITHARGERNQEILAGCSGIDLIIDGEKPRSVAESETLFGTPVVRNNLGGKYVAYIDIFNDVATGVKHVASPNMIRASANTVAEDPQVAELVERYEEERRLFIIREQKKRERAALLERKAGNLYLGSSWCGSCHGEIEKKWLKSRHAEAITSLTAKGRDNDPACLSCHVTGLNNTNAVGGFISMGNNSKMAGVQCEVCHGPGGRHAPFPEQVKMGTVTEATCRACHNHDTDPTFDFIKSLKIVDHGKMPEKR